MKINTDSNLAMGLMVAFTILVLSGVFFEYAYLMAPLTPSQSTPSNLALKR